MRFLVKQKQLLCLAPEPLAPVRRQRDQSALFYSVSEVMKTSFWEVCFANEPYLEMNKALRLCKRLVWPQKEECKAEYPSCTRSLTRSSFVTRRAKKHSCQVRWASVDFGAKEKKKRFKIHWAVKLHTANLSNAAKKQNFWAGNWKVRAGKVVWQTRCKCSHCGINKVLLLFKRVRSSTGCKMKYAATETYLRES